MSDQIEMAVGDVPIACALTDRALAERQEELKRGLFRAVEHVTELADGYEYRFPAGADWPARLLEFIAFERQCCPFFTFDLVFAPNEGPLRLRMRGSAEVKAFLEGDLSGLVAPK